MSIHQPTTQDYRIWPAYCFPKSHTYKDWVKLTAADVQALRSEPAFQSQHIYFHLNHPICYVRLVGVVVAIDDINLKYTVLTIDDGSGATIELKIVRLTADIYNAAKHPSNTTVGNVDVVSALGVFEVMIGGEQVDIGTVVKAKGTISEFRGAKQIELKRAWIVRTTDEEAQAWSEMAKFKKDVLSKPWRLTSTEHKQILKDMKKEKKKQEEYEEYKRAKAAHEAKKAARRKVEEKERERKEAKLESRRRKEEVIMNAGAL
ncbi:hypothetical protein CC80DRAFT_491909, partial [Byssothecium circinans]